MNGFALRQQSRRVDRKRVFGLAALLFVGTLYGHRANAGGRDPKIPTATQSETTPQRTDALGDPLPAHALLRLGTARFHAPSSVTDMALAPNGETVVTVGDELIVWNAKTGKELWRANRRDFFQFQAAGYGLRLAVFSADSRHFYTPGRLHEVIVWDATSGEHEGIHVGKLPRFRFENAAGIAVQERSSTAVDVSPDGRKFVVGSSVGIVICDDKGNTLAEVANKQDLPKEPDRNNRDRLLFGGPYSFGRFAPDGKKVAIVTSDTPEAVRLLDAETGDEVRRITLKARLVRMAFSPDGKQLATTERDRAIRLYDVESGKELWSNVLPLNNPYENYTAAIEFSPDGKSIAVTATDNRIRLIDSATGKESAALTGHAWYPWAVAFTADGKRLYSSGWDGSIRRWDLDKLAEIPLAQGTHASGVTAISPDGKTVAYEDEAGAIRLVDATNGKELTKLAKPDNEYSQLVFSPDGQLLAGGGTSGGNVHATIWSLAKEKIVHRWEWPKGRDPHSTVESLCFTPDSERVAAAVFRQSAAYIWNLETDKQLAKLKHSEIYGLSFSPDGKTLATAGWDSYVRFWETDTGESKDKVNVKEKRPRARDHRMYTVCYAPTGGYYATAHLDGKVYIWSATDNSVLREFEVDGRFVYGAMQISPDGLWVVTGAMDGSVTVWDASNGQRVWDLGRHQGYLYNVAFGRNCGTLLTGGEDGLCYLWDLLPRTQSPAMDLDACWNALVGDDSADAFQAMRQLADAPPEGCVAYLAEKLRPIQTVVDPNRITADTNDAEEIRLNRLTKVLVKKDPKVKSKATILRAVSALATIGTPEAIEFLKELSDREPKNEINELAAAALVRARAAERH